MKSEIEIKQMNAVTVALEIVIFCNDRQKQLLEHDPSKVLVLPRNAVVIAAGIKETEIMDNMSIKSFQQTMKDRV